jgi:hypothetical protein
MCLIAWRQAGGPSIPDEVIKRNLTINPDGFGLMWRDAEGVGYRKFAPSEKDEFTALLARVDGMGLEFGAHWRKATHGRTDREMAHPYYYTDASGTPIVLMHNGIVSIKTDKHESDTYRFVHGVLAHMETGWWDVGHLRFLVESSIGWSRFLLMTPTETVVINEDEWVKHEGIDYSCRPIYTAPAKVWANGSAWSDERGRDLTPLTIRKVESATDPLLLPVPSATNVGSASSNGAKSGSETVSGFGEEPSDWEKEQFGPFWQHAGHYVMKLLRMEESDGVTTGEAACWDCGEEGDYYVIDDQTYFDIDHIVEVNDEQDAASRPGSELRSDGARVPAAASKQGVMAGA